MSLKSFKIQPAPNTIQRHARLAYLPGLDGLRALAVLAVILYHADVGWMAGGFLGVEIFFVISGYLITSLLLSDWEALGRIDLKDFWRRRARRLIPALLFVLATVLAYMVVFLPDEVAGLRGDALAALGYVTNWNLILAQKSYFETIGRPSPLRHLWSLAVEEQFYLLWPLVLTLMLRRWRPRTVLFAMLGGALASALWMAALHQPDADPSRIYYGTDTRATGLLLGAALAFVMAPASRPARFNDASAWLVDGIGFAALGGLVAASLFLDELQPLLYRGGFALVGATTTILIAAVVHPRSRLLKQMLGCRPLVWLGLRSYGIYLWHWPVFILARPGLDVPLDGFPHFALRIAVTLLLAELSYRFVEAPIRAGVLGRAWKRLNRARGPERRSLGLRWASAAVALVVFSVALGGSVASAQAPSPPPFLSELVTRPSMTGDPAPEAGALQTPLPAASPTPPATAARPSATAPATEAPRRLSSSAFSNPAPGQTLRASGAGRIYAIGDSVMLGAAPELTRTIGTVEVDAAVGRQASAAIQILRGRRTAGQLGTAVIVDLGNNGTLTAKQFDEMMGLLGEVRRVVVVNVRVPRPWAQANNDVLAEGVKRYPNAVLVDWAAASGGHPEYFWKDGVHLRPAGMEVYAALIADALNAP